jgi:hypothetical protein
MKQFVAVSRADASASMARGDVLDFPVTCAMSRPVRAPRRWRTEFRG